MAKRLILGGFVLGVLAVLAMLLSRELVRPPDTVFPEGHLIRMFVSNGVDPGWVGPPGGYVLDRQQQRDLRRALVSGPLRQSDAACFVPHHFFRFYGRSGEQVGEVAVCFCCSRALSSEQVDGTRRELPADYNLLAELVTELGADWKIACEPSEVQAFRELHGS